MAGCTAGAGAADGQLRPPQPGHEASAGGHVKAGQVKAGEAAIAGQLLLLLQNMLLCWKLGQAIFGWNTGKETCECVHCSGNGFTPLPRP